MIKSYRFIACSDLHIREKAPQSRKDNFFASQKRKVMWLFKTAQEKKADIICGGDVFDSAVLPYKVVRQYVALALKYNVNLHCVYGQHDLRYHVYKSYANTPLSVLLTAMGKDHLDEQPFENDLVYVQGASWERGLPNIKEGKVNILAVHRLVTKSGGLWPGHTTYKEGGELLKDSDFDIIVSGDNHQSFAVVKNNKYLFNSGSLVRLSTAQYEYAPRVPLVTVTKDSTTYEWLPVPVRKASVVFKDVIAQEEKKEETANKMLLFSQSLAQHKVDKPNYMRNLQKFTKNVKEPGVQAVLYDIMDRAQQESA